MALTPPKWPSKMEQAFHAVLTEMVETDALDWGVDSVTLLEMLELYVAPLVKDEFKVKVSK